MRPSKQAVEHAKKDGLYLVSVELNGRHAKKGSISTSGQCGPETAKKIEALILEVLIKDKERMK